ncbi:MAG: SixA phosphatase family protein [Bacteroidia bacterium]
MKRVLLMRHAKSDWSNDDLSDHQRPLNNRGKNDAPRMAIEVAERGIFPELILVSDAERTRETWELIKEYFPTSQTVFIPELYLASSSEILRIVSEVDDLVDNVMIIAHNPGITTAFYDIAKVRIDNVPTSGIGCIKLIANQFKDILTPGNELEYFIYPKM